ncbi:MAG: hypothetical protein WBI63_10910 [Coriobacteriia bacterium]
MGIVFGLMAVVAGFAHWSWLATAAGILTIGSDALGFFSGALHGCVPTIISWVLGALIGGWILTAMGVSADAALLGGIALASMVEDLFGLVLNVLLSG